MSLFWIAIWGLCGLFAGGLAFVVAPWISAGIAGGKWPQNIARRYAQLAMMSIRQAALVARSNSIELVKVGYDPHKEADYYKLDGEKGHVRDDLGVTGRLFGKPFGLALDNAQSYVSPLASEIGEAAATAKRENKLGKKTVTINDAGESKSVPGMVAGVNIKKKAELARLEDAKKLMPGSASRRDGEIAKSWAEKSQELFHEKISFGQAMVFLVSVALGFAMVFLALRFGGVGAETTDRTIRDSSLLLMAAGGATASSRASDFKMIGSAIVSGVLLFAIVLTALVLNGILSAVAAALGILVGALTLPVGIALLGPSIPGFIGAPLAKGLWILAQMSVWEGVIVRLDTGEYVYCELREDENGYFVEDKGERIDVDGDEGDKYLFGWRPLALTEQKSEKNIRKISRNTPAATDGGTILDTKDVGYQGILPHPDGDEYLIRLKSAYAWIEGASETDIIENGVREAFDQEGGRQQFGAIATIVGSFGGVILGAAIAFVALGGI